MIVNNHPGTATLVIDKGVLAFGRYTETRVHYRKRPYRINGGEVEIKFRGGWHAVRENSERWNSGLAEVVMEIAGEKGTAGACAALVEFA